MFLHSDRNRNHPNLFLKDTEIGTEMLFPRSEVLGRRNEIKELPLVQANDVHYKWVLK